MYKRIALNGIALLGLLAGGAASAARIPGFYVGAGIGEATIEVDDVDFDESDTAFKLSGGYAFNDYFALELAYIDGGSPSMDLGFGSIEVDISGINASAVGRLPVSDVFSLFGKLGYTSYDAEVVGRVGGNVVASEEASDEDLSYGIGAAFAIGESFEVRAEYEAIDISDGSFTILSVSGLFRF